MARRVGRFTRSGRGGWIAVAAISALAAACLAGSPLYLSSVASASVQSELAHTCLADVGVRIPIAASQPDASAALAELAAPLAAHTQPGVLTRIATGASLDIGNGHLPVRTYLVYREGQEHQFGRAIDAPRQGEVLAPEWLGAPRGVFAGDQFTLTARNTKGVIIWTHVMRVSATYPTVPTRPEPAYWCGLRTFFRSQTGDPADLPPALLLTTSDEVRAAPVRKTTEWELRPDPHGLSRHGAAVLADQFDALVDHARGVVVLGPRVGNRPMIDGSALRAVVQHAEAATAVVSGTMAPVRLVGLLSAAVLLIAATTLLAREQQRELRLRLLKGQSPIVLGLRLAASALLALGLGTAVGAIAVFSAVRFFGPSPLLERDAMVEAGVTTLAGLVVSAAVVAVAGALRSRTFVDAPVRHRSRLRYLPWELVPIAGTVFAFARLDRIGGIRQIGTKVANADFWAQCFPVLAIIAPLAILVRPTRAVLRRSRMAGGSLPPSVLTGLRRSLAEPSVTGGVILATALAAGSFSVARLLTDSTSVLLHDKASAYLGSDLTVVTNADAVLPSQFAHTGTVVSRGQGHSGTDAIDFLGVDRSTFAAAIHWRGDAADRSLATLLTDLAPNGTGPSPAIVVGGDLPDASVETSTKRHFEITPVASAHWFPGFHNGAILVVLDRGALTQLMPTSTEIWLRDPPADAVDQLSASGLVARNARDLSQVFDVTSFLTVRWAYASLSMLGALVGLVVLMSQLLVLDARRQNRQAAHVLTRRMGLTMGGEAIGLAAEVGPSLVVGGALGAIVGWAVSRLSVARLDSLRQLRPAARLVAHGGAALPLVIGVGCALAVLIGVGLIMVKRTNTMEVMRGTA